MNKDEFIEEMKEAGLIKEDTVKDLQVGVRSIATCRRSYSFSFDSEHVDRTYDVVVYMSARRRRVA